MTISKDLILASMSTHLGGLEEETCRQKGPRDHVSWMHVA